MTSIDLNAVPARGAVPRNQVFVCYSHRDARWLARLRVHLSPLEQKGIIDLWSDQRIELGDIWIRAINDALARAKVAILLVSSDFLASDFIREAELPALLASAAKGGCRVIPILVGPSAFSEIPSLSRFQHANPGSTTLLEMGRARSERLLAEIAQKLLRIFGGSLD
jgi:hypothetical protein